jgi:hypothetical protein
MVGWDLIPPGEAESRGCEEDEMDCEQANVRGRAHVRKANPEQ